MFVPQVCNPQLQYVIRCLFGDYIWVYIRVFHPLASPYNIIRVVGLDYKKRVRCNAVKTIAFVLFA